MLKEAMVESFQGWLHALTIFLQAIRQPGGAACELDVIFMQLLKKTTWTYFVGNESFRYLRMLWKRDGRALSHDSASSKQWLILDALT